MTCAGAGQWGAGPKVFVYEGNDTMGGMDKNSMRYETQCELVIKEAAWHCTDCFSSLAAILGKIGSFMHQVRAGSLSMHLPQAEDVRY
jgi:beta-1,4-mannosyl-glycoprotein beta-1,4-N-acetylglucosaminyltransferase